jgi:glycosyltransferase involved in cell wall biosynthesis
VHFAGKVSDEQLALYYANCQALIFPGKEDFGLTMAEALSFGKPVIAYRAGGAVEIVKKGKTGTFFDRQTVSSLVGVLKRFRASRYNSHTCKKEALRFTEKEFRKNMRKIIHNMKYKITTSSQPSPKRRRRSRRRISR